MTNFCSDILYWVSRYFPRETPARGPLNNVSVTVKGSSILSENAAMSPFRRPRPALLWHRSLRLEPNRRQGESGSYQFRCMVRQCRHWWKQDHSRSKRLYVLHSSNRWIQIQPTASLRSRMGQHRLRDEIWRGFPCHYLATKWHCSYC